MFIILEMFHIRGKAKEKIRLIDGDVRPYAKVYFPFYMNISV